ncbi:MAG: sulfotransferase domain-containing protein [Pseudomonadota bacterium]
MDGKNEQVPVFIFCYHKCGSKLFTNIFEQIAEIQRKSFKKLLGFQNYHLNEYDIVNFAHSQINVDALPQPFRGVHVVRDPRDVIVSGYFHHLRTNERWCTNQNHKTSNFVDFPQVPHSQKHKSEVWKQQYLRSLNGMSYQENLRDLDQEEGIQFELDRYGRWTTEDMENWSYDHPSVLEIKFEDVMSDYGDTFSKIFAHCGFNKSEIVNALDVAEKHNISNKNQVQLSEMPHVFSRETTRWHKYLSDGHKSIFKKRHQGVLEKLGYARDDHW